MFPTTFRAAQRLARVNETWLIDELTLHHGSAWRTSASIRELGSDSVLATREAAGRWLGDAAIQVLLRDAMLRPIDGSKPRRPTKVAVYDSELLAALERPLLLIGVKMEKLEAPEDDDFDPEEGDAVLPESCELTLSEALPRWMRQRIAEVAPTLAPRLALAESDPEDGLPGWAVVWVDEADAALTLERLAGADRYTCVSVDDLQDAADGDGADDGNGSTEAGDDGGDRGALDSDARAEEPSARPEDDAEPRDRREPRTDVALLVAAGTADPVLLGETTEATMAAMPPSSDQSVPLVVVVAVRHPTKPAPAFARIAQAAWLEEAQECDHCFGLHLPSDKLDDDHG